MRWTRKSVQLKTFMPVAPCVHTGISVMGDTRKKICQRRRYMMPHSMIHIRVRGWTTSDWRDTRGQKALNKAHQEALDENKRREEEGKASCKE